MRTSVYISVIMFILLYDPSLCDTSTEDNSVNVDYLKMLPVPSLSSSLSSDFFTSTEMVNSEKTAPHDPEDPVVIAVEEGKAILTCPVTPPKNDSIDLILWFRGDAETASYSLDARSGPLGRARHFPSNHLSSRAYIDITGRPTSLVIESVKETDSGLYRCRIDFRKGRTQYRAIRLDVIVAPRDLIIMDEYGQRLRDTVGPYNEGAHLTLVCEAEGGNPAPSLIWKKDGGTVDDTWSTTALGIVRNEVVIPRLKRTDLMTSLTCHANNSELTSGKLASVTLDLNLRPLDVKITSPRRPMSAGKKVDLSCQSSGSRPSAVVTWWQGSKLLQHVTEEVSTNENLTISTLHFVPSVEDNGKLLSCRSDHSILPDSALEDSWTLDVFYVPKISLSLGASAHHDQVREGANVSLECHVTANPRVTSVTWQFNSRPLISSPRLGVIIRNQSLFLRKIPRSFSGKFKCLAANVEGEGHSQEISLKVLYAPICKEGQKKLFGVATREPIQVPCSVEADPYQPLTFRWSLNGSSPALDSASNKVLELQPLKSFISSQLTSVLNYSPRTKYGYGQLFCWAKNSIGEQLEPCTFDIVPAGEPDPIQNCLVGNQSSDSLVVKCEPGSDGGLEQIFFLEVYKSGRGFLLSNLSSDRWPMFEVSGLPMSTPLVLVLFAANSKGRSNSVALTTATLPLPNKELNTLTPVIAVLLGIVGSLIVTAIAIMIVGRSRRNKETAPRGQGSARHSEGSERRKVTAVDSMITRDNDDRNNGYHGQRDTELHHYSKKKQNGVPHSQSHCFDAVGSVPYDISETWPGHEEPEMDKYILKDDPIPVLLDVGLADSHVTLEPRVPPEGDVFCDRSDSTSTMSSSFQYGNYGHHLLQQHGRNQLLHHHLPPPPSGHYEETTPQANEQSKLIRENSVVLLNENNSVITETPLINGLYYPDYSSTQTRGTNGKFLTPLSTPV